VARARSFRELRVYRESFRLAMEIFRRSRGFPDQERYGLTSQARRSSRSVCANLAEAWRRRRYPAAFVAKLIDAEAEATETRVHLEFACACGYLSVDSGRRLDRRYDRLLRQLARMRSRPERWLPRGRRPTAPRSPGRPTRDLRVPSDPPPSRSREETCGRDEGSRASDPRSRAREEVGPARATGARRRFPSSEIPAEEMAADASGGFTR
jgi:four helix bundle protein